MELRNCVYGNVKCEWHDCWSSVDREIVSGPVMRAAVARLTKSGLGASPDCCSSVDHVGLGASPLVD